MAANDRSELPVRRPAGGSLPASPGFAAVLSVGTFLTAGSLYIYVPILSAYSEALGASLSLIGVIGASYGFVQLLTRLPLGMLADGPRARLILVGSPILAGLGCLGLALGRVPVVLAISRGLAGLGGAALVAIPPLYAHSFGPSRSAQAMSLFTVVFGLAQTLTGIAGGQLAQRLGWTAPFFVGLVLAVGGAASLLLVGARAKRTPPATTSLTQGFTAVAKDARVRAIVTIGALANLASVGVSFTFVPVRAVELGASRNDLGILVAAAAGAQTVGNLMAGTVLRRWMGRHHTVVLGLAGLSLAFIALPWIRGLTPLLVSQLLSGWGFGLTTPVLMAATLDRVGAAQRGSATGLFQWGGSWGTFAGPVIGGLVGQFFGLNTSFTIMGVLCAMTMLYVLLRAGGTLSDVHIEISL